MCTLGDGIMLGLLLLCSWCDMKSHTIPVWLLGICSGVTIFITWKYSTASTGSFLAGILIGVLFLGLSKITKEAIGYGDSWILILLGAYLGGKVLLQIVFYASVCSGFMSLICICFQPRKRDKTLAFVPFLTAAYMGVIWL